MLQLLIVKVKVIPTGVVIIAVEVIAEGHRIFAAVGFDDQIVADTQELGIGGFRTFEHHIIDMLRMPLVALVFDHILTMTFLEYVTVFAVVAAGQRVVTCSAIDQIITPTTI